MIHFLIKGTVLGICLLLVSQNYTHAGSISANRNNNGFLQQSFRSDNPSDTQIINALYGDTNTAYSAIWSGGNTCDSGSMSVVHLSGGGEGVIPKYLSGNTVYVLHTGEYLLSGRTNINQPCTALIGASDQVTLTTTGHEINQYTLTSIKLLLYITSSSNIILDNININGKNVETSFAYAGVGIYGGASNISMNRLNIFDNEVYGIDADISRYVYLTNSQIFNNNNGIEASKVLLMVIHNSLIFNNSRGIHAEYPGSLLSIANSQIFNNANQGIYNDGGWANAKTIIHNTQVYNNGQGAFNQIISILYGVDTYNNTAFEFGGRGVDVVGYGLMRIFQNPVDPSMSLDQIIIPGEDLLFGWATGDIQTGFTMQSSYHANPTNASGEQLHGGDTDIKGRDYLRQAKLPLIFSYSSGRTRTQTNPIIFDYSNGVCNNPTYDNDAVGCVSNNGQRSGSLYQPPIVIDTSHYIGEPSFGNQSVPGPNTTTAECFAVNVNTSAQPGTPSLCTAWTGVQFGSNVNIGSVLGLQLSYKNSTTQPLLNQFFGSWIQLGTVPADYAIRQTQTVYFKVFKPDPEGRWSIQ